MRAPVVGLDRVHVAAARAPLEAALRAASHTLELDFAEVRALDSTGAALLSQLIAAAKRQNTQLRAVNVHPSIARSLALFPATTEAATADEATHAALGAAATDAAPPPAGAAETLLLRIGESVAEAGAWGLQGARLARALLRLMARALRHPSQARLGDCALQAYRIGVQALPVVGLIAFLVGITVAMQSAAQLRQFGANVFVVDLVAVAITRELGPLIAAIVVAGRSGAAAAAEIATMVITEEIDALRTMGIDPLRYVVYPKVVAICVTQPLLTVLANAIAIGASFLVALLYLDVAPGTFGERLWQAMLLKDVVLGLVKSATFGALIMLLAATVGLRTQGGADAVGRSTTASVVAAIFAIILADAAFSLTFYLGN